MTPRSLMVHRITIETRTVTTGVSMGPAEDWTTIAPRINQPCRIQPMNASDRVKFKKQGEEISHVVYFDYDPVVTDDNRLVFGTRIMNFRGALEFDEGQPFTLWKINAFEDKRRIP